jgi:hypothetical protein
MPQAGGFKGELYLKKLVYTIICFKCILQITEGSPYQKYIKLFSQLLILCMCCGVIAQTIGNFKKTYEVFDERWNNITSVILNEEDIRIGSEYYDEKIMELYEEVSTLEYEPGTGEAEIGD